MCKHTDSVYVVIVHCVEQISTQFFFSLMRFHFVLNENTSRSTTSIFEDLHNQMQPLWSINWHEFHYTTILTIHSRILTQRIQVAKINEPNGELDKMAWRWKKDDQSNSYIQKFLKKQQIIQNSTATLFFFE